MKEIFRIDEQNELTENDKETFRRIQRKLSVKTKDQDRDPNFTEYPATHVPTRPTEAIEARLRTVVRGGKRVSPKKRSPRKQNPPRLREMSEYPNQPTLCDRLFRPEVQRRGNEQEVQIIQPRRNSKRSSDEENVAGRNFSRKSKVRRKENTVSDRERRHIYVAESSDEEEREIQSLREEENSNFSNNLFHMSEEESLPTPVFQATHSSPSKNSSTGSSYQDTHGKVKFVVTYRNETNKFTDNSKVTKNGQRVRFICGINDQVLSLIEKATEKIMKESKEFQVKPIIELAICDDEGECEIADLTNPSKSNQMFHNLWHII